MHYTIFNLLYYYGTTSEHKSDSIIGRTSEPTLMVGPWLAATGIILDNAFAEHALSIMSALILLIVANWYFIRRYYRQTGCLLLAVTHFNHSHSNQSRYKYPIVISWILFPFLLSFGISLLGWAVSSNLSTLSEPRNHVPNNSEWPWEFKKRTAQ